MADDYADYQGVKITTVWTCGYATPLTTGVGHALTVSDNMVGNMPNPLAGEDHNLQQRLIQVAAQISQAAQSADRDSTQVTLIGASKTQPIEILQKAWRLGLRHFGENYLNEAVPKITAINAFTQAQEGESAVWHYIGRIQSNKTRQLADHFDWIHTVDRMKIAQRLSDQCPAGKCLNVLVQVNIDGDPDKAGVAAEDTLALVQCMAQLPNLQTRGLMTILSHNPDDDSQASSGASYQSMAQLSAQIRTQLPPAQQTHWDTLSMGMSGDLQAAIAAGATQVRVGTALFGKRP